VGVSLVKRLGLRFGSKWASQRQDGYWKRTRADGSSCPAYRDRLKWVAPRRNVRTKHNRSALFWEITQRIMAILCRRFGTSFRSTGFLTLEDGTDRLSRSFGKVHHYTLRNFPEERRRHVSRRKPEITQSTSFEARGHYKKMLKLSLHRTTYQTALWVVYSVTSNFPDMSILPLYSFSGGYGEVLRP
jgi:hypothetical protein